MAIATLPVVLAVVLTELAVGGAFVSWFVDRAGRAPSGFLKLVAFVDLGAVAAALALVPTFPRGDLAERAGLDLGPLSAFGHALLVVLVLALIQLVTGFLPARGLRLASSFVACLAGAATLGVVAVARPSQSPYDVLAIAALPLGAMALGGSDGAMLLGHWALATPNVSPGALRRASLVAAGAVAMQIALVLIVALRGGFTATWGTARSVALRLRLRLRLLLNL